MNARTTTPRRRTVLVAVLVALASLLTACTSMPTSGPVNRSDVQVADPGDVAPLPEGPHPDAQPIDIVAGYLLAGATGFSDDFVTARQYLAGEARQTWKPLAGVVVAGNLQYTQTSDTQVTVDVSVVARVDGDGRYVEAPPDARESVTYDMVSGTDGQWRIAGTPDGLVVSQGVFDTQFRAASVYFLSPDETFLVPETRWFPAKKLPTYVMKALLAGPSPWLRDAVTTAIPDGTQLKPESVVVDGNGVARVGLEPAAAVRAADRGLMLAQIDASMRVAGVGKVQVLAGDVIIEGAATLDSGPLSSGDLEMIQADRLVRLDASNKVAPVEGVGSLKGLGARYPAVDESGAVRVAISRGSALVTLPTGAARSTVLATGAGLVAPSVDRFGWAWTAKKGGILLAGRAGVKPVTVHAAFLQGREVRAVRVERDGVRIVVVSSGPDGVAIDVGAVVRDAKGAPQQVGDVIRAGAALTDATSVVWADESALAVVGRSDGQLTVHQVPVSGPSQSLPEVADLAALAGGRGLVVSTTKGELRRLVTTWAAVPGVADALDPYFPG
ncbi:LpqB family beta-propeller domain-containing protein [Cellulomonas sp. HZM]|uniref:LpqB family beta-propeller domain-containing protein n=1 Tax=Cellulomonas sp. HZM TaxID=1454010 RepID=UPI0004930652|nr:LpqB family beta-propeller domain-containing protein [Cellulomonas sp. HZM]